MAVPQQANTQVSSQRDTEAANDAKYGLRPNPTIEYSDTQKKTGGEAGVRNVRTEQPRTSTMPGAPKNQAFSSSHPDSATVFNAEYAKKGVQPQSNLDAPKDKYQPVKQITRSDQATRRAEAKYQSQPVSESIAQSIKIKGVGSSAATAIVRSRVSTINASIWSWGTFCWLVFQVPFALLSLAFLVTAGMIDSFSHVSDGDGVFKTGVAYVVKGVSYTFTKVSQLISETIGLDISVLNPQNLFMLTWLIIMAFGMIMLLSIYLIYKVSMLNPLSGRGSGFKLGACLLAFIGYTVPILNLLPWFYIWTIAVWRYPK